VVFALSEDQRQAPQLEIVHHGPTVISLFRALSELKTLKTQKDRARSLADKATLNSAIKTAIDSLKQDFPTTAKME